MCEVACPGRRAHIAASRAHYPFRLADVLSDQSPSGFARASSNSSQSLSRSPRRAERSMKSSACRSSLRRLTTRTQTGGPPSRSDESLTAMNAISAIETRTRRSALALERNRDQRESPERTQTRATALGHPGWVDRTTVAPCEVPDPQTAIAISAGDREGRCDGGLGAGCGEHPLTVSRVGCWPVSTRWLVFTATCTA
jgi:hypothetical protein